MNQEIERGVGLTDSEKHLDRLADHTFLDLWAYPNLYIDKQVGGQGKELCDLLVVCGNDVIVFSDKNIRWPEAQELDIAWGRWYKRAIGKSVDQVNGAARWVTQFPDRIFLDKECKRPLPINLPPASDMRLHGIVVAKGAGDACRDHYGGGTGSLVILGKGVEKEEQNKTPFPPFSVGDVNPNGMFVHVLDDGSLDVVLGELDTITDFTDYLTKKELLIRSGQLNAAEGEEDLVAYYMTHMVAEDEHGFPNPETNHSLKPGESILFQDVYRDLRKNDQYIAKKVADRASYVWDDLIRAFTKHMLDGTTVMHDEGEFDMSQHEVGVRYMAMEGRFRRRIFGHGILDALEKGRGEHKFARGFIPRPEFEDRQTAFFFLTVAYPDFELEGGYQRYRQVRLAILETYAYSFLHRYEYLPRIVGIGTEPLPQDGVSSRGSSEDLVVLEQPEWTSDLIADLRERQNHFDVMKDGVYREYSQQGQEWPET